MAAVVTRDDIARAEPWSKPSFSSSSYGGNPLASAAVAASLGIIVGEKLAGNAAVLGARFVRGLREISERHPEVAHIRGEGLMIGFDLVTPSGEPWTSAACRTLFNALLSRGIISMAYAPRVRINPPLVINEGEVDERSDIWAKRSTRWRHDRPARDDSAHDALEALGPPGPGGFVGRPRCSIVGGCHRRIDGAVYQVALVACAELAVASRPAYMVAATLGAVFGAVCNFSLNRWWVFR